MLIDRERLEAVLTKRFPGAAHDQVAAAANAIIALIREAQTAAAESSAGAPVRTRAAPRLP